MVWALQIQATRFSDTIASRRVLRPNFDRSSALPTITNGTQRRLAERHGFVPLIDAGFGGGALDCGLLGGEENTAASSPPRTFWSPRSTRTIQDPSAFHVYPGLGS